MVAHSSGCATCGCILRDHPQIVIDIPCCKSRPAFYYSQRTLGESHWGEVGAKVSRVCWWESDNQVAVDMIKNECFCRKSFKNEWSQSHPCAQLVAVFNYFSVLGGVYKCSHVLR